MYQTLERFRNNPVLTKKRDRNKLELRYKPAPGQDFLIMRLIDWRLGHESILGHIGMSSIQPNHNYKKIS